MFLSAFFTSSAIGVDFFLFNTTSEPLAVPVVVPAGQLGFDEDGSYVIETDGHSIYADVYAGSAYILADVPPVSGFKCRATKRRAESNAIWKGRGDDQDISFDFDDYSATFEKALRFHRFSVHSDMRGIIEFLVGLDCKKVFSGVNLAVVETDNYKQSEKLIFEIYRSGIVKVKNCNKLKYRYVTESGNLITQCRRADWGIVKKADGGDVSAGLDYLCIEEPVGKAYLALVPAGDTKLSAKYKGNEIDVKGDAPEFYIMPVSDKRDCFFVPIKVKPSILFFPEGDAFSASFETDGASGKMKVFDRNGNDMPDAREDMWAYDGEGNGRYEIIYSFGSYGDEADDIQCAVYQTDQANLGELVLDETGGAQTDRYRDALNFIITENHVMKEDVTANEQKKDTVSPAAIVRDFNGDGAFFEGSLLEGGFTGCDKIGKNANDLSVGWDLDGDKMADVFENSVRHYILNYLKEWPWLFGLDINLQQGKVSRWRIGGYQMQSKASMFSKSCLSGKFYKGASQGFEEHFFIDLDSSHFPDIFENGANFFYYTNGGGNVNRMTMGRLHGYGGLRAWEIELDPDPANREIVDYRVIEWPDAWGNTLKLNTISGPDVWDGSYAEPDVFLRGWYAMAQGKYKTKGLRAAFLPPGSQSGSSEGMYAGALTSSERIEIDRDGGTYILYFSKLMGELHLKGADFGTHAIPTQTPDFWLDINRYYHREAHIGDYKEAGILPDVKFASPEAKRMEGPVFLDFSDLDGDQYFDTYLYDMDNDGFYDRTLRHNARENIITLKNDSFITAWPEKIEFEEVLYLPENYDRVSELYKKGFHSSPMVVSSLIGSAGIPTLIESEPFFKETKPNFFVSLPQNWHCTVAADTAHTRRGLYNWRDFKPTGLSRLGTMFVKAGLKQTNLKGGWSEEALADTDVLIVADLSVMPRPDEIETLRRYVENGGKVVLACNEDPAVRIRFDALGEKLGYSLSEDRLNKRTAIYRYASLGPVHGKNTRSSEHRMPAPWNEIHHFDSPAMPELLDGFDYLSFAAYPLENLSPDFEPLLTYGGDVIMARAKMGRGVVIVSGADWFTNRYIWHHEFFENGAQNDILLERVVMSLCADLPIPEISAVNVQPGNTSFVVTGKGGKVRFKKRYDAWEKGLGYAAVEEEKYSIKERRRPGKVFVNGRQSERTTFSVLNEIEVPAGRNKIEIVYEKVE